MERKIVGWPQLAFALVLIATSPSSGAAEYEEHFIIPQVKTIVFSPDSIAVRLHPLYWGDLLPAAQRYDRYFVSDRLTQVFRQTSQAKYSELQSKHTFVDAPREYSESRLSTRREMTISRRPHDCELGAIVETKIEIDDHEILVKLDCESEVSDVVRIRDSFWIGTSYGSDGLLIVSPDGTIKKQIPTGGMAVTMLVCDPWSWDVWVVSEDRVIVVSTELDVVSQFWPIHGFDRQARRPDVLFVRSNTLQRTRPLAVYAYPLGDDSFTRFFDLVEHQLDDAADDYSLYDYYMRTSTFNHEPQLPNNLNELLNFAEPTDDWRRFACMLPGTRAKEMCHSDPSTWND